MKWTVAGKSDFNYLIDFLLEKEWEHTFFSSRIIKKGGFVLPPKSRFPILILREKDRIKAACMITLWGALFPVFRSIDPPDDREINELVSWINKNLKRVHSIMGTEERVDSLRNHFEINNEKKINYNLMIREHKHFQPIMPQIENFKVLKAEPDDSAALLGLELEYQREEVFLDPTQIKNTQIYHNLRSSLNDQIVYYMTKDIVPIAKAGTNSRGHKWNQIGGVYTDREYRNKGISSWLMYNLLDILENDGKKTVLFVKDSNKAAEKVYTKLGFEIKKKFNIIYYI